MSAKNPNRLYVAEKDSPRLWLAPSEYTRELFKSTNVPQPKKQKRLRGDAFVQANYPELYLKDKR